MSPSTLKISAIFPCIRLRLLLMLLIAAALMQTAFGQKTNEDNEMSSRGHFEQQRLVSQYRVHDMLNEVMDCMGNRMYERIEMLMKNAEEKLNEKLRSLERNMLENHRTEFERHSAVVDRLSADLDEKLERQSNASRVSIEQLENNLRSNLESLQATGHQQQIQLLQQHNESRNQLQRMGAELREQIERHRIEFDIFSNKSQTCSLTSRPRDCADVMSQGHRTNGVYTVYVGGTQRPLDVYCDMTTDGGGWTVIQRRKDGCENFYRNWTDYASGFGNLNGEFWLGNDHLYSLTVSKSQRLRIDLADFDDATRYAEYSNFKVAPSCEKYKLISVGTYTGTAGDSMSSHVGQKFSTFDQDNDALQVGSCSVVYKGAWWYTACHHSNLNGLYLRGNHTSYADGVDWYYWTGHYYSLRFSEMKIRPNIL